MGLEVETVQLAVLLAFLTPSLAPCPAAPLGLQALPHAAQRRELASIRLLVAAERDFEAAEERLEGLEDELAGRPEPDAAALASEARALRSDVRRALGKEAPAGQDPAGGDKVDEAVRRAIGANDYEFIRQLGARAAAGLAQAVREEPDELPSKVEEDPFYWLCLCSHSASSALCEELVGEEGYFWKRRFLRALAAMKAFERSNLWSASGELLAPGYVRMLESLVDEPDLLPSTLGLVGKLVDRGALTPPLEEALVRAMQAPEKALREQAWDAGDSRRLENAYESLLASPDLDVQLRAAYKIRKRCPKNRALLGQVDHPDRSMRETVATHLEQVTADSWSAEDVAVLARLLLDEDREVQTFASQLTQKLPTEPRSLELAPGDQRGGRVPTREILTTPLPLEVYRALAGHPLPEMRHWLCSFLDHAPTALALELARELARDPERKVAHAVAQLAERLAWEDPAGALAVLEALLERDEDDSDWVRGIANELQHTHSGTRALWRWSLTHGGNELIDAIKFERNDLPDLPPDLMRPFFARFFAADPNFLANGLLKDARFSSEQISGLRAAVLDADLPAGARLMAARFAPPTGAEDEEWYSCFRSIVLDPSLPNPWDHGVGWNEWLGRALYPLDGERRHELLLALVEKASTSAAMVLWSVPRLVQPTPGGREVAIAALRRGFENADEDWRKVADAVLERPDLAPPEWLRRAAQSSSHAATALVTIGKLRDPEYLPLLDELLHADGSQVVVEDVARALRGYLSDEAGELLLFAATRLSGEELDACLAHIEKIREYQDARERWATRRSSSQARAEVIAELVRKLDAPSDEVKVQAIRALATWEAVECMPRLIDLSTSSTKSVAQAAREALDRLNAGPKD